MPLLSGRESSLDARHDEDQGSLGDRIPSQSADPGGRTRPVTSAREWRA